MFRLALGATLALASVTAADPPAPTVVDLKAQTEFALKVERSVRENDAKSFKEFFDSEAFSARVFKDLSAPESFLKGVKSRLDTFGPQFFGEFVKKAPAYGDGLKLLQVRLVDGEPRALFRWLDKDGGLNYLDFVLTVPETGKPIRIADAHIALTGELLSQTMTPILAKGLAALQQNEGDVAGLNAVTKKFETIARFMSLVRSGKSKDALVQYEKLPAEYKKEKVVMLAHVLATGNLIDENPDAYEKSIDAFVKKYPTDPAVELVSIDGFLLKKKYAEFHKGIDRLDKSVGGDPYLHVVRGNGFQLEGKSKEAKTAIGRAIAADPDLTPAYMSLADMALEEKDFKELARLLTIMEARLGIDFSGVATTDEYAGFRKSPEYAAWWKAREKK